MEQLLKCHASDYQGNLPFPQFASSSTTLYGVSLDDKTLFSFNILS